MKNTYIEFDIWSFEKAIIYFSFMGCRKWASQATPSLFSLLANNKEFDVVDLAFRLREEPPAERKACQSRNSKKSCICFHEIKQITVQTSD